MSTQLHLNVLSDSSGLKIEREEERDNEMRRALSSDTGECEMSVLLTCEQLKSSFSVIACGLAVSKEV